MTLRAAGLRRIVLSVSHKSIVSFVVLQMQGVIQVTAASFCDGGQWKLYDPTCFANQPTSQQITEEVVIDPTGRQRLWAAKGLRGCMLLMWRSVLLFPPLAMSALYCDWDWHHFTQHWKKEYTLLQLYFFLPHRSPSPSFAVSSSPPLPLYLAVALSPAPRH